MYPPATGERLVGHAVRYRHCRSPLGGKLSPIEEWKRLQDPASRGRELMLDAGAALAALQASTLQVYRQMLVGQTVVVSCINSNLGALARGDVTPVRREDNGLWLQHILLFVESLSTCQST